MPRPARRRALLAGVALLAASAAVPGALAAGSSADATVRFPAAPGQSVAHYAGTAPFNNGQAGLAYGQLGLDDPTGACTPSGGSLNEQRHVAVQVPKLDPSLDTLLHVQIAWTPVAAEPLEDLALHVFGPDGALVGSSDGSAASEGITLAAPAAGTYDVLVCAFQNLPSGTPYKATITALTTKPGTFPKATGVPTPTYRQYTAPKGLATAAGEPSIGTSWKTGHTLFTANTDEYDVAFDDRKGTSTWTSVNQDPNGSNTVSLDPIGYTDSSTGRSFISQLLFACSGAAYSDDDFRTSKPSEGCGTGINGFDHQTLGGGPFAKGTGPALGSTYPHAVYYCSQGAGLVLGGAFCSRSDDGGVTFGAPVDIFNAACSGIHGHVRVGPDGTVYVPDTKCGGKQGVAVSEDGGKSWTVRQVPDSIEGASDPSVATGRDGTVYFGYSDGTGRPRVAISRDHGRTWTRSVDVGTPFGLHGSEFAEVIAGDGDRAAFAFLGTATKGSTQAASFGKSKDGKTFTGGTWHLYVATTYDRGRTWTTVDATPTDPVQRGCVWNSGGSNPCRNLLDFNDITVDKTGRVMVGFSDGCVPASVEPDSASGDPTNDCSRSTAVVRNGLVAHGAVLRQTGGRGLFKAYDKR
ncbi:MAG: exo-alpha-sialidase [Frankiales bacterium]|nr:exo-alpha-sialidase [Frankiales bacterium]